MPSAGEDCRTLHRDVARLTRAVNAIINMTALVEAKKRSIGFLEIRGDESLLHFRADLSGGKTSTTTSLTSSANPSQYGDNIHFTATISDPRATGTVQFNIDGVDYGPAVAVANGQAQSQNIASLSPLSGGQHAIKATYTGDNNFFGSNGAITQQVNKANSSTNLSSNNSNPVAGDVVQLTANVDYSGSGSPPSGPTGTVQFKVDGTNLGAAVAIDSNGNATKNWTATSGSHTITADYSGDANYNTSSDSLSQTAQTFPTAFSLSGATNMQLQSTYNFTLTAPGGFTGWINITMDSFNPALVGVYPGPRWNGLAQVDVNSSQVQGPATTAGSTGVYTVSVFMNGGTVNFSMISFAGVTVNYGGGEFASGAGGIVFKNPSSGAISTVNGSGRFEFGYL